MQKIEQSLEHPGDKRAASSGAIYYGWVIVAVCFVVLSLISLVAASFPIFYVPALQDFNRSRGSIALAMTFHMILSGVASPLSGWLIDRFGPRLVMPLGALTTGGALLWLSRSSALWQFYLTFGVLAAIGSSMLHITPTTAVASNWFDKKRGTAISIVVAGPGAGQLFLLPLLQNLINHIGWRNTYFVFGAAISIIPTVLTLLFLWRRPADRGLSIEDEKGRQSKIRNQLRALVKKPSPLHDKETEVEPSTETLIVDKKWVETDWTVSKAVCTLRFWALTAVMALIASGLFMVSVHLAAYLVDKGYSSTLAASVMGFQGFVNIIGSLVGGMLGDRIGREKTLTLAMITFIGCITLLNIGGSIINPALVYGFALFYGMGYGMAFPAFMASAADLFQGNHFGSILGVIMLCGYFGAGIGAWMGGYFFDLTHAYRANFLVAGLMMLTSAILIWKVRPSQVRLIRTVGRNKLVNA